MFRIWELTARVESAQNITAISNGLERTSFCRAFDGLLMRLDICKY